MIVATHARGDAPVVHVMTQYWKGDSRVCELECAGRGVDIHMSRPTDGDWVAEAHSDHGSQAVVIVGTGSSRSAALLAVARAWRDRAAELGLQSFDWTAIADALRSVKACD